MPLRSILEKALQQIETLENQRQDCVDPYDQAFQLLKALSENLRSLPEYTCNYGEQEFNRRKNRYKDILPFDYTRVILSKIPDVPGSDYINANYIKGASGSLAYIASQGPLPHTVEDFWRMVWECEVQVIIMASSEVEGGKHKCERYWVYENEERTLGKLTITLIRMKQICTDFLVRTMNLRYNNESRTIIQFHYVTWPDHGIPDSVAPILNMVKLVRDCQASETLPILVHCSAGCGRTGTICAIDYVWGLLRTGKLSEDFTLFQLIVDMRKQRVAMVQTKEQYILVHRAVKEMFKHHLQVIDSHPYENIDFSGLPLIDQSDSDLSSNDSCHDANKNPTVTADQHLERILCQFDSFCVPPLPEKKRTIVSPKLSEPLLSSGDISVKQLISTWNSGKPCPVDDSETTGYEDKIAATGNSSCLSSSNFSGVQNKSDHTDIGLHRDDSFKLQDADKSNTESEFYLSFDKAVVLRKPSIAKLKALFEKTSPQEVSSEQMTGQMKDYVKDTDKGTSDKKRIPGLKRHKSHLKKQTDALHVTTRYKDTALKVYAEIKKSDEQETIDCASSSPESNLPASFERRKDSPESDLLSRLGSQRRSLQRNSTSVWYDKEAEHIPKLGIGSPDMKNLEKPVPSMKRSKSLKVQSITENAFGILKLSSPLRHHKYAVAAYLAVEEEQPTQERNNKMVLLNENPEVNIENNLKSIKTHDKKIDLIDIIQTDVTTSSENSLLNSNLIPQVQDSSKNKVKTRYLFHENTANSIPGFSTEPVELVHVKSSIELENNATNINVIENANVAANHQFVKKSKSVDEMNDHFLSRNNLEHSSTFESEQKSETENLFMYQMYSNTIPNSGKIKKYNNFDQTSHQLSKIFASKHAEQIEDKPPLIPMKMNSPLNSPQVQHPMRILENVIKKDNNSKTYPLETKVTSVSFKMHGTKQQGEDTEDIEISPSSSSVVDNRTKLLEPYNTSSGDDEEGYQQIIRNCQEYLNSSSYLNTTSETQKNLIFTQESPQENPCEASWTMVAETDRSTIDLDDSVKRKQVNETFPIHSIDSNKIATSVTNVHKNSDGNIEKPENYNIREFSLNLALDVNYANTNPFSEIPDIKDSVLDVPDKIEEKIILSDSTEEKVKNFDGEKPVMFKETTKNYEQLWLSHSGDPDDGCHSVLSKYQTDDDDQCLQKILSSINYSTRSLTTDSLLPEIHSEKKNESKNSDVHSNDKHIYCNIQTLDFLKNESITIALKENDSEEKAFSVISADMPSEKQDKSPTIVQLRKLPPENNKRSIIGDLSSYKILKEILHQQNSLEESCKMESDSKMLYSCPQNFHSTTISFPHSASQQSAPPKRARVHSDNKSRKPQPLPRNILTSKKDTSDSKSSQENIFSQSNDANLGENETKEHSINMSITAQKVHRDEELYSMLVHENAKKDNSILEECHGSDSESPTDLHEINNKENYYEEVNLPPNIPVQERLIGFPKITENSCSSIPQSVDEFHDTPVLLDSTGQNTDKQFGKSLHCCNSSKSISAADHVYESLDHVTHPAVDVDKQISVSVPDIINPFISPTTKETIFNQLDASEKKPVSHHVNRELHSQGLGLQTISKEVESSMYSEISKGKANKSFVKGSPSEQNMDNSSLLKDDLELCPVAPPRKRQSSSSSLEMNVDQFWRTGTVPGRHSVCLQDDESFAEQWGEEWDSDDDCQPPVPAKTKEAYMLPSQRDTTTTSSGNTLERLETKNKSFSKFSLFSKLGLKIDNKNSDLMNATAKVTKPGAYSSLSPVNSFICGEILTFPNRLPRRPHGPRSTPPNWNITVPPAQM